MTELKRLVPEMDPEFYFHCLNLVLECRMALTYSYVIGYYLPSEKKEFFKFLVNDLAHYLEVKILFSLTVIILN